LHEKKIKIQDMKIGHPSNYMAKNRRLSQRNLDRIPRPPEVVLSVSTSKRNRLFKLEFYLYGSKII